MPIKDASGDVIGVAQVINKLSGEQRFTDNDEKVSLEIAEKFKRSKAQILAKKFHFSTSVEFNDHEWTNFTYEFTQLD